MTTNPDHPRSGILGRLYAVKRWMYRGGRPGPLARALNRLDALLYSTGLLVPRRAATLEVRGRSSGRTIAVPVVVTDHGGHEYLVSMLGDGANWVRNVRAAGGHAVLRRRRRRRTPVVLQEVETGARAPILRRYLDLAPGARPHLPVTRNSPPEDFDAVATSHPVFRIGPAHTAEHT
ncbi:nitroreductase family deazaflavin-dependent oxidoreductase [Planomonospora corallina]|uniref:Nitroreductase family deazaflavin-dependent oxidoreductase n=1 Tax=Planomonospora corallina TaxID=1806052 RepID=A0ABV8IB88_9ACTN